MKKRASAHKNEIREVSGGFGGEKNLIRMLPTAIRNVSKINIQVILDVMRIPITSIPISRPTHVSPPVFPVKASAKATFQGLV